MNQALITGLLVVLITLSSGKLDEGAVKTESEYNQTQLCLGPCGLEPSAAIKMFLCPRWSFAESNTKVS